MADTDPGLFAQILGRVAYEFNQIQPMLPTYIHLIASALFPIYTGAHASLSRPSTAATPAKKKRKAGDEATEDEDEEEQQRVMEGLSPTDAILMPLFAGTALASLYFLLKWMKDPALLNKLLNGYFAIFGVFSVSRLVTDALNIGHSIIFPRRYALGGALYHVDGHKEKAVAVAGSIQDRQPIASPLPGFLAHIPLAENVSKTLWADRAMPGNKWTLKLHLHRLFTGRFKVGPHDIAGVLVGLTTVAYFNLVDKPWYLTNLLGFGFSYGALQLMSPTTFATGSLILGALFFYDIYFVFFTPMMVTVAKSLDVPIKLIFPRPSPADDPTTAPSFAMLGLGDVVLPGIMIGLALRFDLYLFYLRRQIRTPAAAPGEDNVDKPKYHSLAGCWSDHFWTHTLTGWPLWVSPRADTGKSEAPFTFPKVYFKAGLVGYILGLLATLGVMMVWNHAQPALLYLVPGVLGSVWLTALVRGELDLMWNYTEAIEEEEESKKTAEQKDSEASNDSSSRSNTLPGSKPNGTSLKDSSADTGSEEEHTQNVRRRSQRSTREVFSFSIEAPWKLKKPKKESREKPSSKTTNETNAEEHNWVPSKNPIQDAGAEPSGKRLRVK